MYSIVLAMALAPGSAAPAADIQTDIQDLKSSVAELRKEQDDTRVEDLKRVIAGLRQRLTDAKLDELRRDVTALRHEEAAFRHEAAAFHHAAAVMSPMQVDRRAIGHATIAVEVPADTSFVVNNKEIPVPTANPTFITPPLEPGRDYFYDCKVTVAKDGKKVTKNKRVKVHAGEVVHINFDDMESH